MTSIATTFVDCEQMKAKKFGKNPQGTCHFEDTFTPTSLTHLQQTDCSLEGITQKKIPATTFKLDFVEIKQTIMETLLNIMIYS